MKLSIIIPIFNEKKTIREVISRIEEVSLIGVEKELILVDDFSQDGTREILKEFEEKYKVIYHDQNRGKGAALRTGFGAASGELVIIQDADLEMDPQEYPKLLEPIIQNEADVVYGSRFLLSGPHRVINYQRYLANKLLTFISNVFSNLKLTDMETCYKLFRKTVLDSIHLKEDRFGFEPEVTAKIAKLADVRIYEVPVSYKSRMRKDGKKIGFKDGLRAIWCIIRYNLFN